MAECITQMTIDLMATMVDQDPDKPETTHEDEGSHVRVVGCEGYRQCIVEHYHGSLVLHERGKRDGKIIFLNMDDIFRKCFVSILKANDGMPINEALPNGLNRLSSYEDTSETIEDYEKRMASRE